MSEIFYDQVRALGFERMDYTDNVVFKKCGHHPFHMSKELPGRLVIYWYSESYSCELLRLDKKQNILSSKKVESINLLLYILEFFGFEEDVEKYCKYMNTSFVQPAHV